MRFLTGRLAANFKESISLMLDETGYTNMSAAIPQLFTSSLDMDKLVTDALKIIGSSVRIRYGTKAKWDGAYWFVPIPQVKYDISPVPLITFIIRTNIVAPITVRTVNNTWTVTLVGDIEKPNKLLLPVTFLQGIIDDDLAQFRIASRDAERTGWSIPGLGTTIWLPDEFTSDLSSILKTKSVADWLADFGSTAKTIIPLVVGTLLGLLFADKGKRISFSDRRWDEGTVIENLTRMFGSAVAKERFQRNAFRLKASMTNDEATRVILSDGGNDGKAILNR